MQRSWDLTLTEQNLITNVDILDEAKDNFLTYAEEVLTDRAIPSAEDGLLSAQRKILWTMEKVLNMTSKSKTKKSQAVIGTTQATSYIHGDASCYGVICKMAQTYLMRYPLIDGQGSLGTQEANGMQSASRYTEVKPSVYADLMMADFDKDVVPLKESYNNEYMEPVILPGLFPNALCNGGQTIGLSMSHSRPSMNLTEVCNGIVAYIKNNNITLDEIMEYIKGPDFPLGGVVINEKDIKAAFATGHSVNSLKVRGDYIIEGRNIIFTSIPYRTYRNNIKDQIYKNIDEFSTVIDDFDDESNVGKNRLVFKVKKGVDTNKVLAKLFALTDLQTTISYNMNFIVNGTPKLCSLLDLIKHYVEHQEAVLVNKSKFDKDKAEKRKHILDGLIIIIDSIDKAINIIRNSDDKESAQKALIKEFKLTEAQAKAVLDMRLSKLTKMDKSDLLNEISEKIKIIAECTKIIGDKEYCDSILIKLVENMKKNYGDERRTKLENITETKEEVIKNVIEPEKCVVILTESGHIKRIPTSNFKTQNRNGKGVRTQSDITSMVLRTNTVDSLMIFDDTGMMYRLSVNDIPEGTNSSIGQSLKILAKTKGNPTVIYSIYKDTDAQYVMFATKGGMIKKTPLEEYIKTNRKSGISAIKFKDGDSLATVTLMKDEDVLIFTKNGRGIKVNSSEIPTGSRTTIGVKGINLDDGDEVSAVLPIRDSKDDIALFDNNCNAKRFPIAEVPFTKRGTKGSKYLKGTNLVAALINDSDTLLVCGDVSSICVKAEDIPETSKSANGNKIIKANNTILSVSKI